MDIEHYTMSFKNTKAWIIKIPNIINNKNTLLLSKVSEAISPNVSGNHIGEGSNLNDIMSKQEGIRFIINGSYNHYRKGFYNWHHDKFNVGDPVGAIKIREHSYEDYLEDLNSYGFFVQKDKFHPWEIKSKINCMNDFKYVLGCTPLLISNYKSIDLDIFKMEPLVNQVCPPSYLGHGLENHPRSAIGLTKEHLVFIVIESPGCSLLNLQELGIDLGLEYLLNLDGGGSSQFKLRLSDGSWVSNNIENEDKNRVLGNVIILFDEDLKNKN